MIHSIFTLNVPARRFKRSKSRLDFKNAHFPRKTDFSRLANSPISWGTNRIIPLPVVLSRKIFKKVTRTIFPGEIAGISTFGKAKSHLFAAVNNVPASFFHEETAPRFKLR
jgi:hypothetical protein